MQTKGSTTNHVALPDQVYAPLSNQPVFLFMTIVHPVHMLSTNAFENDGCFFSYYFL